MNKSNFELKDLKENAEYVKGLNERQKSFIQGYIAGAKDAQPALAAKEPEKQEMKQMPIEVEELVNKILKELEESGKRYDLILPNLYTLEEPKK